VLVRTRGFQYDTIETQIIEEFDDSLVIGRDWAISPAFENIVLRPTSRAQWNTWTPNERLLRFITKVLFPLRGSPSSNTAASTTECTIITHIDRSQDTSEISLGVAKVTNQNMLHTPEQRNQREITIWARL